MHRGIKLNPGRSKIGFFPGAVPSSLPLFPRTLSPKVLELGDRIVIPLPV